MDTISLPQLSSELLTEALAASNGRHAHTVYGGRGHALRQTMIAMRAGERMAEHKNPGEATLHLVTGSIELRSPSRTWALTPGDLVAIPDEIHSVEVLEDSVFLLTVVKVEAVE